MGVYPQEILVLKHVVALRIPAPKLPPWCEGRFPCRFIRSLYTKEIKDERQGLPFLFPWRMSAPQPYTYRRLRNS